MATLFQNTIHEDLNPLEQLYFQITNKKEFNARELLNFLKARLPSNELSLVERQTLRLLSSQAFKRLDRNKDGLVSLSDLQAHTHHLLSVFLSTPHKNAHPSFVSKSAELQFYSISKSAETLSYPLLYSYILQKIPSFLPCRTIAAKISTLLLLEICIGNDSCPPRDRTISCSEWVRTALALQLN